jgi:hypothetical protein
LKKEEAVFATKRTSPQWRYNLVRFGRERRERPAVGLGEGEGGKRRAEGGWREGAEGGWREEAVFCDKQNFTTVEAWSEVRGGRGRKKEGGGRGGGRGWREGVEGGWRELQIIEGERGLQ